MVNTASFKIDFNLSINVVYSILIPSFEGVKESVKIPPIEMSQKLIPPFFRRRNGSSM